MGDATILRTLTTEELDESTRAAIIEVCVAAHNEPDFRNLFSYVSSGGRHFLGYRGKELVSHAGVTTRWLHPDNAPRLKTAYVDAVATHPSAQGQGVGSAVMRALAAGIGDYDIACLETDIPGFYTRLGWEVWRGPLAGRESDGTLVHAPEQTGILILRLPRTPPLNLEGQLTIEIDGRIW